MTQEPAFQTEVHQQGRGIPAQDREAAVAFFLEQEWWSEVPRVAVQRCVQLAGLLQRHREVSHGDSEFSPQLATDELDSRSDLQLRNAQRARRTWLTRYLDRTVREIRLEIFGDHDAPFSPDQGGGVAKAADWIEEQFQEQRRLFTRHASTFSDADRLRVDIRAKLSKLSALTGIAYEVHARRRHLCFYRPKAENTAENDSIDESAEEEQPIVVVHNVRESLPQLVRLADESERLSTLTGLAREDVVLHILCGFGPQLPPFVVVEGSLLADGFETSQVSAVFYAYPSDRTWREAIVQVRERWRGLESEDPDDIDRGGVDPLDDIVSESLERLGHASTLTRAAKFRGGRTNPSDVRLERLVEELGGLPQRGQGRLAFFARIAEEWQRKGYGEMSGEALRKRWERMARKAGRT